MMKLETSLEEKAVHQKYRTIPLITTKPAIDLGITIILLPVWWLLGVEQFIFPVIFVWVILKILMVRQWKFDLPNVLVFFTLFLLSQVISALLALPSESIETWFVFIRNFVTSLTGFLILFILTNSEMSWQDTKRLIITTVIVFGFIATLGMLAILGLFQFEFQSPISAFFPKWFLESDVARRFTLRSFGHMTSFFSFKYFRLTMFFSFPTLYASAIIAVIPISMYCFTTARKLFPKALFLTISIFLMVNLIFTTGRAAIGSVLIGFIYYQVVEQKKRKVLKWSLAILTLAAVLIVVLLNTNFSEAIYELFAARSTGERFILYSKTISYWLEKPIFGWATARNIEETGLKLPLGSHSYYFAILFRFGLAGFLIFSLQYLALWSGTRPLPLSELRFTETRDINKFLQYGRWAVVSVFIDGVATIPITDMSTMVFVWLVFGLLLVARRQALQKVIQQDQTA